MSNTRSFSFRCDQFVDGVTLGLLEEVEGVVSVEQDSSGTTVMDFDPSYLTNIADELGALGLHESEQEIYEENYDLLEEEQ